MGVLHRVILKTKYTAWTYYYSVYNIVKVFLRYIEGMEASYPSLSCHGQMWKHKLFFHHAQKSHQSQWQFQQHQHQPGQCSLDTPCNKTQKTSFLTEQWLHLVVNLISSICIHFMTSYQSMWLLWHFTVFAWRKKHLAYFDMGRWAWPFVSIPRRCRKKTFCSSCNWFSRVSLFLAALKKAFKKSKLLRN